MGIFNFLKKDKADTAEAGLELPPVPSIEGMDGPGSFPEMPNFDDNPLPDNSLPPLPTDVPGAVPPKPTDEKLSAPKMDLPEPPAMEVVEPKKIEVNEPDFGIPEMPDKLQPSPAPEAPIQKNMPPANPMEHSPIPMHKAPAPKPEFPTIPEMPSADDIPDNIPPLEGLPEAPKFTPEPKVERHHPQTTPEQHFPEMPSMMQNYEIEQPLAADFMPEERHTVKKNIDGPMFIRTDKFRQIIEHIEHVRSKFTSEDDTFSRISDVKNSQDQKYEEFRQNLEDIQRKLLFIDRSLFESTTRS